jgi:hypothetical protein
MDQYRTDEAGWGPGSVRGHGLEFADRDSRTGFRSRSRRQTLAQQLYEASHPVTKRVCRKQRTHVQTTCARLSRECQ